MKFSFHPDAEDELNHSIAYYEDCQAGLGYDFAIEVYLAIERAVAYPESWQVVDRDVRRSLVNRFPYGVLYSEEDNEILILAVMHLHKKPGYWKNRG